MVTREIRGALLRYETFGEAGPWVALMPGGRRGFDELVPLARKLASRGSRVLLHDRRNCGASDIVIDGDLGEEEIWADDLAQLLQEIGAASAFIGGTSSGARASVIFHRRHPHLVRGLILIRVTGGSFAAGRLPNIYYGQFIEAARQGGMAAVCEMPDYQERIRMNPRNRDRLMAMDKDHYIRVMAHWLEVFRRGPAEPMLGVEPEVLRAIRVPAMVVPGNDRTHGRLAGEAVAGLIPGAVLKPLPIEDTDEPLLPFADWAPVEERLATSIADFMGSCDQPHQERV
jgi:pimeloyl-ACP methyl ester carboxylesterase